MAMRSLGSAIRKTIKDDGTWLVKEIRSHPDFQKNLRNPMLAMMYGFSVAGCLSSTPDKALASGRDLGLPDDRNYPTWETMLEAEQARPEGDRIDVGSVVTPNHAHFEVARAFVEAGIHVICD